MPNLFKPARSRYWYFWYYDPVTGNQRQLSCRTTDKKKAHIYAVEAIQRMSGDSPSSSPVQGRDVTLPPPTSTPECVDAPLLSVFMNDYLSLIGQRFTPKTVKTIRDSFNQLLKRIGDQHLDQISIEDAERFIWTGQPSSHTARKHYQHLRAAFEKAVLHGKITVNVFTKFRKPKAAESYIDHLTPVEFSKLLSAVPTTSYTGRRLRTIITIAFETGMRLGEIQHLEVSAISLTARQIHVRNTEEFTVKSKRNRTLPLSESAAEAIAEFSRERAEHTNVCVRESKYLFPNPVGSTLNVYNLVHAFTAVARKVFPSRSIHFHCLRHSFGTRLAMANVPLHMIQKLMGHSSVKVTERYAHTSNMSFDSALAVLNHQGEP